MNALALVLVLGPQLANPSFADGLKGWEIQTGAQVAKDGPASRVDIDGGALRLAADAQTRIWKMVTQRVAVNAGDRVIFSVLARCKGVRHEGRYVNANALARFEDAQGRALAIVTSPLLRDDRAAIRLRTNALAPPNTAFVRVGFLLSVPGTVWIDDAELRVGAGDDKTFAHEALRMHLADTYPFFGLPGKPKNASELAVDVSLEDMLADLEDVHVWIHFGRRKIATWQRKAEANWNPTAIGKRLRVVMRKPGYVAGMIGDDVGYVLFKGLATGKAEDPFDHIPHAKSLILDLRPCQGGNEMAARKMAARFVNGPTLYAKAQTRDPTLPGNRFLPPVNRVFGKLNLKADRRPVAVLQGPWTVSSAEGFLLMLKTLKTATSLGLPSAGASANPKPFPLMPRKTVWSSTWRSMTPDGKLLEGIGIKPDVEVTGSHRDEDVTLVKALELLRKR